MRLTRDNLHRVVGIDSRSVRHSLSEMSINPDRNGDIVFRTCCEAYAYDTIDIVEGTPNCVRCLVARAPTRQASSNPCGEVAIEIPDADKFGLFQLFEE
jgi:hypothetical protein